MKAYIRSLREELATMSPQLRRLICLLAIAPSLLWMPMIYYITQETAYFREVVRFIINATKTGIPVTTSEPLLLAAHQASQTLTVWIGLMVVIGMLCAAFPFLMPSSRKLRIPQAQPDANVQV